MHELVSQTYPDWLFLKGWYYVLGLMFLIILIAEVRDRWR